MSYFKGTMIVFCVLLFEVGNANGSPKNSTVDKEYESPIARRPAKPDAPPPPVIVYSAGIANPDDWPATYALGFPIKTDLNGDKFRTVCTATAVSRNVVITAAHCMRAFTTGAQHIDSELSEDFRLEIDGEETIVKAYCDKPNKYKLGENSPYDWALCKLDKNLNSPQYETFASEVDHDHKTSLSIILLGYGCIAFHDGHALVHGEFEQDSTIEIYNYAHRKYVHYDRQEHLYYGPSVVAEDLDGFFTTRKGALLCPGDSGGAAYTSSNKFDRRILGINSQAKLGSPSQDASYIAKTTNQEFLFWALSWANKNKVEICGLNSRTLNCR